ncbi:PREDICTED: uncharacterized protein LOC109215922 [Nicotiana attenuata]|uniref:uncharacterized protein LOC109215922 n=1 Tax=Nicotiana attenuata TaxID=49451 RepID=UPI000904D69C|nr:PREDICTED: uncharacterized protein LOC109215922 [Nicotiana attenuata]
MPDSTDTPPAQTSSGNGINVDLNHPFFLHSSDAPGMSLVNAVFDGKGFQGWKRFILIAISAKNKAGFINVTVAPPPITSKDYQPWSSVIYSNSARDLWISLEHRFGQSNGAKLCHLQKELSGLSQGTNDIASYFTRLKRLWDELDSLNSNVKCTCTCICEGKKMLEKSQEDERLIQFFMGLNEAYGQARGNILMMSPLPNINHAYSLVLQDENQREVYANPLISTDASSFMVVSQANFTSQGNFSLRNGKQKSSGQFQRNNNVAPAPRSGYAPQKSPNPKGKRTRFNPNVSCTYCKKTGHTVDDCYRIIGFPDNFEFTNPRTTQGGIRSNVVISGEQAEDNNNQQEIQAVQIQKSMQILWPASLLKRAQVFGEAR